MSDPDTSHRNEPPALKLPPGIPPMPECVDDNAHSRIEWTRVTRLLTGAGVLTEADMAALAIYCNAWARLLFAEEAVKELGEVIVVGKHGMMIQNPWRHVATSAADVVMKTSKELGFTPASRARIKIEPAKPVNKLAAFNARGNGTAGKIG